MKSKETLQPTGRHANMASLQVAASPEPPNSGEVGAKQICRRARASKPRARLPFSIRAARSRSKMAATKRTLSKIARRKLRLRETLWPEIDASALWDRKTSDGWLTVPRAMPLLLRIMDLLAPKGKPVSATYLDLWCRTYDDSFVVVSKPREMAYFAGFTGERAQHTWVGRIRQLSDLGFVEFKEGANEPVNYVLLLNPFPVVRRHIEDGTLRKDAANALRERMLEVGATDLDDG